MKSLKKYLDYLPLAIIGVTFIYCLIVISISEYSLHISTWLGFFCAFVSFFISFFSKRYYILSMGIMLFLGTFGLLSFTPTIVSIGFTFLVIGVTIEPYSFILLIIYIVIFNNRLFSFVGSSKNIDKIVIKEKKPNRFLRKFEMKNDDQLQEILNDKERLQEARDAAEQILQKRKSGDQ